jgi:hypothetical protein
MDQSRLAPLGGIVASLCVAGLLVLPYGVVRESPGTAVAGYYGSGAVNPLFAGVLALVLVIVFAAGREERTDPVLAAGVGLSFGLFVVGLTGLWAVTVPPDFVFGMAAHRFLTYHRWAMAGMAVFAPVASLWWARTLGLV